MPISQKNEHVVMAEMKVDGIHDKRNSSLTGSFSDDNGYVTEDNGHDDAGPLTSNMMSSVSLWDGAWVCGTGVGVCSACVGCIYYCSS